MPEQTSPKAAYPNSASVDKMPRESDSATPVSEKSNKNSNDPAPKEIGGPKGLEPTRYGDWEKNGRCIDF